MSKYSKKSLLPAMSTFLKFLLMSVLLVQCQSRELINSQSDSFYYPTATQYATKLNLNETRDKQGKTKKVAGHFTLMGPGQFSWEKQITKSGNYEVVLDYSAQKEGANVTVSQGKNTVSNSLPVTTGLYLKKERWNQLNFERKVIGTIHLAEGSNPINLEVNVPGKDFETDLYQYALELIPIVKKPAVKKELTRARAARPPMKWFTSMDYGVMFHWTSRSAPRSGPKKDYQQAVKEFDVKAFADMVKATGAEYIIFTASHADPHFPAPLEAWEEEHPGWTTERDLIAEIADQLKQRNIKLFLYFATHVYAKLEQMTDLEEFENINNRLISEVGKRYKDKVAGYWFDGWYQILQKFPEFNFEEFYGVTKKGNPDRIIALNSWLYPIVTQWQDYWAGEIYTPGIPPKNRIIQRGPGKGLPYHALLALESGWVHAKEDTPIPPPQLNVDELISFITATQGKGPVTLNVQIYQDGTISKNSLAVLKKLKAKFQE